MGFPAFITRKLFTVSSISNLGETGKDKDYSQKVDVSAVTDDNHMCSTPWCLSQLGEAGEEFTGGKISLIQSQTLHLSNFITTYLSL